MFCTAVPSEGTGDVAVCSGHPRKTKGYLQKSWRPIPPEGCGAHSLRGGFQSFRTPEWYLGVEDITLSAKQKPFSNFTDRS